MVNLPREGRESSALKNRLENITQETEPEGPIKGRRTRNMLKYSLGAGSEATGHAQLWDFLTTEPNTEEVSVSPLTDLESVLTHCLCRPVNL